MLLIKFVSEEEKEQLINKYSKDYELKEVRYLFDGNELIFKKKVNGMTIEDRLEQLEIMTNMMLMGEI